MLTAVLPLGLLGYSAVALATHWFISGMVAPVVAVLLWRRHPRARFSSYVFLSVVVVRGFLTHSWLVAAFGAVMILVLQLPDARAIWPTLSPRDPTGRLARSGRSG
jgi:hypothetical protein